ncbi:hypothetical protein IF1G_07005 [Cordyceps javanica]|uniref:Uncharacterized protein n=1 Tax=Cordyceps javanica TaxID=43265 RepID=A0A545UXF5_9HYPO|nr:hypothetical protein IF1G_07005 [Cordyceps javanica]TQW06003.1 hypothetical protein IF2G_06286 [Cordyceps javanica]
MFHGVMPNQPCRALPTTILGHATPGRHLSSPARQALEASSASCVIRGLLSRGIAGWLASRGGGGRGGGGGEAALGTALESESEWLRIDLIGPLPVRLSQSNFSLPAQPSAY